MSTPTADGKARAHEAAPAAARPVLTPARGLTLHRRCACGGDASDGASCSSCAEKDPMLQKRGDNSTPRGIPASVHQTLAQPGRPLDTGTRSFMESRFGEDFSGVRIHDDSAAAQSARDVHAHAYTVGESIVFAPGQFQPHSESGQHLLAHELAHTVQQKGLQRSGISNLSDQGPEYRRLEFEADRAADFATRGGYGSFGTHGLGTASRPTLSRVETTIPPSTTVEIPVRRLTIETGAMGPQPFHIRATGGIRTDAGSTIQEFQVTPLYMPVSKGPNALSLFRSQQGTNLSAIITMNGPNVQETGQWQRRPAPSSLQSLWFNELGVTRAQAATLWQDCSGASFPIVGTEVCQWDHIVELQLGGTNVPQNFQALDPGRNGDAGSSLFQEGSAIARTIQRNTDLTDGTASQIRLQFMAVEQAPTGNFSSMEQLGTGCCPVSPISCLSVDHCVRRRAQEESVTAVPPGTFDEYHLAAGTLETIVQVPPGFAAATPPVAPVTLAGSRANRGPSMLISGLSLQTLNRGDPDFIEARVDPSNSTRIPITMDRDQRFLITLGEMRGNVHVLRLERPMRAGITFTYPFLSPGTIRDIELLPDGGANWTGVINTSVPLLPSELEVESRDGGLSIGVPLDTETLSNAIPGFTVTDASLGLELAPELAGRGRIDFALGSSGQLATGSAEVTADATGLSAHGEIHVNIPGVDDASGTIDYRDGNWSGQIVVESSQISIPNVQSGRLVIDMDSSGITPSGEVTLALPRDLGTATLGIARREGRFEYSVEATINVPGLRPVVVEGTYDGTTLVARARDVGFEWNGFDGTLAVTYRQTGDAPGTISGSGRVSIRRGGVTGTINVRMNDAGRFSGDGEVSYPIMVSGRRIDASAQIIVGEDESVRVVGTLRLPDPINLFRRFGDDYTLFSVRRSFLVPGLSIGVGPVGVGVTAIIQGSISVGYGFGPGELRNVELSAGFNPLAEHIDPSINFHCDLHVPVSANLSATIGGGLGLEAGIGRLEGTLSVTATLNLGITAGGSLDVGYENQEFTIDARPGVEGDLNLNLSLDAHANAELGNFGFTVGKQFTWNLGSRLLTLGHFSVYAPIHYDSTSGLTVPTMDQLEWGPITTPNVETLLGQLFSGSTSTEREVPT